MFISKWKEANERLQRINPNQILLEIWKDPFVQDFIVDLNTEGQLRFGLDSRGILLSPPYRSNAYARAKRSRPGHKAPFGIPDLNLTNEFYETFRIKADLSGFEILANTSLYGDDFRAIYGFDIIGLSDESIQKLVDFIRPIWYEKIYEITFQKQGI